MKQKKRPSWTFRCTVVTILCLLALYLVKDGAFRRELLWGDDAETKIPTPGEILQTSVTRMEEQRSLSAKIGIRVSTGEMELGGNGKYEELKDKETGEESKDRKDCFGATSLFRLHLELPRLDAAPEEGGEDNLLDIVCDKNTLWTYTSIEGEKKLSELKLTEMASTLAQTKVNEPETKKLAASGLSLPTPLSGFPGLGGIGGLLRQLTVWYDFSDEVKQVSMKGKKGTLQAWKLTGRFKEEAYAKTSENLLGDNPGERKPALNRVPAVVEVYIGRADAFPYRFRYFSGFDSKKQREIMTLDFTDVCENHVSVVPENFVYIPGGLTSTDKTRNYIEGIVPGIEY